MADSGNVSRSAGRVHTRSAHASHLTSPLNDGSTIVSRRPLIRVPAIIPASSPNRIGALPLAVPAPLAVALAGDLAAITTSIRASNHIGASDHAVIAGIIASNHIGASDPAGLTSISAQSSTHGAQRSTADQGEADRPKGERDLPTPVGSAPETTVGQPVRFLGGVAGSDFCAVTPASDLCGYNPMSTQVADASALPNGEVNHRGELTSSASVSDRSEIVPHRSDSPSGLSTHLETLHVGSNTATSASGDSPIGSGPPADLSVVSEGSVNKDALGDVPMPHVIQFETCMKNLGAAQKGCDDGKSASQYQAADGGSGASPSSCVASVVQNVAESGALASNMHGDALQIKNVTISGSGALQSSVDTVHADVQRIFYGESGASLSSYAARSVQCVAESGALADNTHGCTSPTQSGTLATKINNAAASGSLLQCSNGASASVGGSGALQSTSSLDIVKIDVPPPPQQQQRSVATSTASTGKTALKSAAAFNAAIEASPAMINGIGAARSSTSSVPIGSHDASVPAETRVGARAGNIPSMIHPQQKSTAETIDLTSETDAANEHLDLQTPSTIKPSAGTWVISHELAIKMLDPVLQALRVNVSQPELQWNNTQIPLYQDCNAGGTPTVTIIKQLMEMGNVTKTMPPIFPGGYESIGHYNLNSYVPTNVRPGKHIISEFKQGTNQSILVRGTDNPIGTEILVDTAVVIVESSATGGITYGFIIEGWAQPTELANDKPFDESKLDLQLARSGSDKRADGRVRVKARIPASLAPAAATVLDLKQPCAEIKSNMNHVLQSKFGCTKQHNSGMGESLCFWISVADALVALYNNFQVDVAHEPRKNLAKTLQSCVGSLWHQADAVLSLFSSRVYDTMGRALHGTTLNVTPQEKAIVDKWLQQLTQTVTTTQNANAAWPIDKQLQKPCRESNILKGMLQVIISNILENAMTKQNIPFSGHGLTRAMDLLRRDFMPQNQAGQFARDTAQRIISAAGICNVAILELKNESVEASLHQVAYCSNLQTAIVSREPGHYEFVAEAFNRKITVLDELSRSLHNQQIAMHAHTVKLWQHSIKKCLHCKIRPVKGAQACGNKKCQEIEAEWMRNHRVKTPPAMSAASKPADLDLLKPHATSATVTQPATIAPRSIVTEGSTGAGFGKSNTPPQAGSKRPSAPTPSTATAVAATTASAFVTPSVKASHSTPPSSSIGVQPRAIAASETSEAIVAEPQPMAQSAGSVTTGSGSMGTAVGKPNPPPQVGSTKSPAPTQSTATAVTATTSTATALENPPAKALLSTPPSSSIGVQPQTFAAPETSVAVAAKPQSVAQFAGPATTGSFENAASCKCGKTVSKGHLLCRDCYKNQKTNTHKGRRRVNDAYIGKGTRQQTRNGIEAAPSASAVQQSSLAAPSQPVSASEHHQKRGGKPNSQAADLSHIRTTQHKPRTSTNQNPREKTDAEENTTQLHSTVRVSHIGHVVRVTQMEGDDISLQLSGILTLKTKHEVSIRTLTGSSTELEQTLSTRNGQINLEYPKPVEFTHDEIRHYAKHAKPGRTAFLHAVDRALKHGVPGLTVYNAITKRERCLYGSCCNSKVCREESGRKHDSCSNVELLPAKSRAKDHRQHHRRHSTSRRNQDKHDQHVQNQTNDGQQHGQAQQIAHLHWQQQNNNRRVHTEEASQQ